MAPHHNTGSCDPGKAWLTGRGFGRIVCWHFHQPKHGIKRARGHSSNSPHFFSSPPRTHSLESCAAFSYCFIAVKGSWPQIQKGRPFCRFHWLAGGTSHTSLCVSGECLCFSCTSDRTRTDKAFVIWWWQKGRTAVVLCCERFIFFQQKS